ncbi:MAG: type 1 glutamine amidotransferase domain-containing protein [Mycobacterium sp.]|nr:type 1 glutamine amidotransferase domain-containing protein [Mycobacterium sp.]
MDPRRRHQAPLRLLPEEVAAPHEVFTQAGFDITIATPGAARPVADEAGFTPEMNGGATELGERFRSYLAGISDQLAAPADLNAVKADDYDLVFIPGGHAPMEDLAVSDPIPRVSGAAGQ